MQLFYYTAVFSWSNPADSFNDSHRSGLRIFLTVTIFLTPQHSSLRQIRSLSKLLPKHRISKAQKKPTLKPHYQYCTEKIRTLHQGSSRFCPCQRVLPCLGVNYAKKSISGNTTEKNDNIKMIGANFSLIFDKNSFFTFFVGGL